MLDRERELDPLLELERESELDLDLVLELESDEPYSLIDLSLYAIKSSSRSNSRSFFCLSSSLYRLLAALFLAELSAISLAISPEKSSSSSSSKVILEKLYLLSLSLSSFSLLSLASLSLLSLSSFSLACLSSRTFYSSL